MNNCFIAGRRLCESTGDIGTNRSELACPVVGNEALFPIISTLYEITNSLRLQ